MDHSPKKKISWVKPLIEEISISDSLGKENFPVTETPKSPGAAGLDVDVDAS